MLIKMSSKSILFDQKDQALGSDSNIDFSFMTLTKCSAGHPV